MKRFLKNLFLAIIAIIAIIAGAVYWQIHFAPTPATTPPVVAPLVPLTGQIDHILIEKSARRMTVFRAGDALRSYDMFLGFEPVGDKFQEGDGKTPEGIFTVNRRNPKSAFHLSLGIDYPQASDRARAAQAGVSPGGDIFIHGQPNDRFGMATILWDWTAGCIAISNDAIEELWRVTPVGTTVEIRP